MHKQAGARACRAASERGKECERREWVVKQWDGG